MMDEILSQKQCGKCKEVKLTDEFYKNIGHKDGLDSICKKCHYENGRRWAMKNALKVKEYLKQWREENREHDREQHKQYKLDHPDIIKKSNKKYSAKHAKRISEYCRKFYKEHPGMKAEQSRKWHAKHPWKEKEYSNNKRARKLSNGGTVTEEEWINLLEKYGYKCLRCGRTDVELTMDHVKPLVLGGRHSIENIQPLCRSCNSSKNATEIDYRIIV